MWAIQLFIITDFWISKAADATKYYTESIGYALFMVRVTMELFLPKIATTLLLLFCALVLTSAEVRNYYQFTKQAFYIIF